MESNNLLEKFQREVCPDISMDSHEFVLKIIEEIIKLRKNKVENNE